MAVVGREVEEMKTFTKLITLFVIAIFYLSLGNTNANSNNDFDLDGIPDSNDLSPYDFNNDGINDATTYDDIDADGIEDYPYGIDYWLNTTTNVLYMGEFGIQTTTNLTAEPETNRNKLSWEKVLGTEVLGYNIYRSLESGCNYSKINNEVSVNTTYLDENVVDGVTYYYVIKTVNQTGFESRQSMEVSATPLSEGNLLYIVLGVSIIVIILVFMIVYTKKRKSLQPPE